MFSDQDKSLGSELTALVRVVIRMLVMLPSDTLQGHKRLSPQGVLYEFKLLLALKQIFTFRLVLQGKKWAFHTLCY